MTTTKKTKATTKTTTKAPAVLVLTFGIFYHGRRTAGACASCKTPTKWPEGTHVHQLAGGQHAPICRACARRDALELYGILKTVADAARASR